MKIKVSGFPSITTKYEIKRIFSNYGTVHKIKIAQKEDIAYLDMPYELQARNAIKSLDGSKMIGREIKVEEVS